VSRWREGQRGVTWRRAAQMGAFSRGVLRPGRTGSELQPGRAGVGTDTGRPRANGALAAKRIAKTVSTQRAPESCPQCGYPLHDEGPLLSSYAVVLPHISCPV
jgi:hypothetical protein